MSGYEYAVGGLHAEGEGRAWVWGEGGGLVGVVGGGKEDGDGSGERGGWYGGLCRMMAFFIFYFFGCVGVEVGEAGW